MTYPQYTLYPTRNTDCLHFSLFSGRLLALGRFLSCFKSTAWMWWIFPNEKILIIHKHILNRYHKNFSRLQWTSRLKMYFKICLSSKILYYDRLGRDKIKLEKKCCLKYFQVGLVKERWCIDINVVRCCLCIEVTIRYFWERILHLNLLNKKYIPQRVLKDYTLTQQVSNKTAFFKTIKIYSVYTSNW